MNAADKSLPDKSTLRSFTNDLSFVDIWRKQNPHGVCYTWINPNCTQASRLDRFLLSHSLARENCHVNVLPCSLSDHDFVILNLSIDGLAYSRNGIWKFNTSLLSDQDFCKMLSSFSLQKRCIDNFATLGIWWDNLKLVIRDSCIDYCKKKRRAANRERNLLTNSLIRAKAALALGDNSVVSEIKSFESSLASLVLHEAKGALILSRQVDRGGRKTD